jgi:hypothetical protein
MWVTLHQEALAVHTEELRTETLNLRVSPSLKAALQAAARREHRSMANMVEFLVLAYCEQHRLTEAATPAIRSAGNESEPR